MNPGRLVLSQILDLVHRQARDRLVERYDAEFRIRHFGCSLWGATASSEAVNIRPQASPQVS